MTSKNLMTICLFSFGVLTIACKRDNPKPNIVIFYVDDLGWADVGFNGNTIYETPNMDKMAEEGLILSRFYPSAANCAPSRASMLTGMYTPRHHVYLPQGLSRGGDVSEMRFKVPTHGEDSTYNTFQVNINHVDPKFESLAELLSKAGYTTARFGKWHIGDDNQGFHYNSANGESGNITNVGGKEDRYYNDTLVAQKLTDASIKFIKDHQEKPFFLYLSHWEVHGPMAARNERIAYYKNKIKQRNLDNVKPAYAAEVEQLDISLGRINDVLKQLNLESNTIVIFASDNGGVSNNTSNKPLRAGKGTFYEAGIRTPCCIKWPGTIMAGGVSEIPVIGIDFMPTFAELANVPLPKTQPVDGRSIVQILKGEKFDSSRAIYFHFPLYLGSGGLDKVLPSYHGISNYWRAVPLSVIIKDNWKLIYYYEYEKYELYNLKDDFSESHDLSSVNPKEAKKLLDELFLWSKNVNAPIPEIENVQ